MVIPTNLEECFVELKKLIPEEDLEWLKSIDEDEMVTQLHHGLGRSLRNDWGLWNKESVLYKFFEEKGLWHADDMSGVILTSFHRHLMGKDLDVEGQVQGYKDFWEDSKNGEEKEDEEEEDKT